MAIAELDSADLIASLIDPELITFLDVESRDEAIYALSDLIAKKKRISKHQQFYEALLQREDIVSTGIGLGVAIPHAKLEEFEQFHLAIGIQSKRRPIDWKSLDQIPVRLIFMIVGPVDKQVEYLSILSGLTRIIRNESIRARIIQSRSVQEVMSMCGKTHEV